ncbi:uncharacterized protein LOC143363587 [Halictus rubicundus]|uniref:uncharacterized protein LOC143363587 n=2 Tax=Halictus rubicundus TaxID=77578 RepID=UPI004036B264
MTKLESASTTEGYYLPHHAIVKTDSLTTKVRVVFDASAKTTSGQSLNDNILTGPTIQEELYALLIKFRTYTYVITADIEKMYRQIEVSSDHRIYQKILWRETPDNPIETYALNTVTYGTSAAPFLAIRTLFQLAADKGENFPRAARVLREDFYVDDMLTGADTFEEAVATINEIQLLCAKGGFKLRKWATNKEGLIHALTDKAESVHLKLDLDTTIKTLGVYWNARTDAISYMVKESALTNKVTKHSTVALHWIKSAPHTLKTFISHRVTEIQEITDISDWRHIASAENPADFISRGMRSVDFIHCDLWHRGPSWLALEEEQWPISPLQPIDVPELRPVTTLTTQLPEPDFLIRRGRASDIYSDNATNFVGANKEIRELYSFLSDKTNNQAIVESLANQSITWHFIPPRSPHFGGIWEAAVKSLKHHLVRVMGEALLSFEGLLTLTAQIEAVLNSRPLTPISSDPNDLTAITPGHFLIGESLINMPDHDYAQVPDGRLSSWQDIQKIKAHFWKRWKTEYLQELTVRRKWHSGGTFHLPIGSMVILQEDNTPPMKWPLGRVTAIHPGEDGIIRVVTVKTSRGEYKRSVKRLSPLPVDM